MDKHIKEFLASGKLELYIYGELSSTEKLEVENYISKYPAVRDHFNQLQKQLELLAVDQAKQVPTSLKRKIMDSLDNKPKSIRSKQFYRETQYLLASSVILGITTILALALWAMQYSSHQKELIGLQAELISCNQDQEKIKFLEQQVAFFQDPTTEFIDFQGNGKTPDFTAKAQVNKQSSTVFLQITQIPSIPEDKVIQVWGDIDGEMIPVAVLATLSSERMKYSIDPSMESLNFTLENKTTDGKGQDHPDVTTLFASSAI